MLETKKIAEDYRQVSQKFLDTVHVVDVVTFLWTVSPSWLIFSSVWLRSKVTLVNLPRAQLPVKGSSPHKLKFL